MMDRFSRWQRSVCVAGCTVMLGLPLGCGLFEKRHDTTMTKPVDAATVPLVRSVGPAIVQTGANGQRPATYTARVGPYAFNTDFPLDTSEPIYRELEDLPEQIERELNIPTSNSLIQIFLFEDEDKYHAFLRAKDPKLPMRSAYFFAEPVRGYNSGPDLHIYTWFSPRLKTDLRHELTHALLHGTLRAVPIWLDEGLAGFFEQPPMNDGVNVMHLDALRNGETLKGLPFRADLARLEKLKEVSQMGRAEYQESWAWVHYFLRGEAAARKVFLDHLRTLRTTHSPGSLLSKLEPEIGDPNVMMMKYLSRLDVPTPNRVRAAAMR